jgi:hypothetical protein
MQNTGARLVMGIESSTGAVITGGSSAYAGVLGTIGATSLQLGANNAIRMTLNSSGQVGIGTTTPQGTLHLTGANANIVFEGDTTDTTDVTSIVSLTNGDLAFRTNKVNAAFSSSVYTKLTIQKDGNVGIGTASPGGLLTLNATADTSLALRVTQGEVFKAAFAVEGASPTYYTGSSSGDLVIASAGNIRIGSSASTGEKVFIDTSTGSVGIGTTTPGARLEVAKTVSGVTDILRINDASGTRGNWNLGLNNNTGLYVYPTSGAGSFFSISTAAQAASRFYVDIDGGNVGIDSTNPLAKLQINYAGAESTSVKMVGGGGSTNGNMIFGRATDYSDTFPIFAFTTAHVDNARANDFFRIHSGETSSGAYALRVTTGGTIASPTRNSLIVAADTGNVGIGDASPDARLDLDFDTDDGVAIRVDSVATNQIDAIRFVKAGDANRQFITWSQGSGTADWRMGMLGAPYDFTIYNANGGAATPSSPGTAFLTIQQTTGNVGIGETGPSTRLWVKSSNADQITIERTGTGNASFGIDNVTGTADLYISPNTSNSGVALKYRTSGGSLNNGLVLDESGIVGIGTTLFTSAAVGELVLANDKSIRGVNAAGNDTFEIIALGSDNYIHVAPQTHGTKIMGSLLMPFMTTGSTGNYVCVKTDTLEFTRGNGSACSTSSIRYKENVLDIGYGLDAVLSIRPVEFNYKAGTNNDSARHLGFIAEEMYSVIPEVVNIDEEGLPGGIDYPVLTAVLTKAVQELNTKIESIELDLASASTSLTVSTTTPGFFAAVYEALGATLVDGVVNFARLAVGYLTVGEAKADRLCLGQTCVTETELIQLLQNNGTQSSPAPAPQPFPESEPAATSTEPVASSTPETISDPEPETTSEPEPEPTPVAETVSEPEPAAEPVVESNTNEQP